MVQDKLPLRASTFAVLAAMRPGPVTGVEILDRVSAAETGILGPGTLYRMLRELRNQGWIERVPPPEGNEADERMQHHALTSAGRRMLDAEAARLRRTLRDAGLLEEPGQ